MSEVQSYLKPDIELCPCGCGVVGRPRVKAWRDGLHHARTCKCQTCRNANNSRKGKRKQSKALTAIGVPRSVFHPGHEEHIGGRLRSEVKAGLQCGPLWTRYTAAEAQSEQARPIGDNRPFVFVAMPEGTSDGLVAFRLSKLPEVVAAFFEQLDMGA